MDAPTSQERYSDHVKPRHEEKRCLYACIFALCCCFCCFEVCEWCLDIFCCGCS